jgi:hypothetical protein
MAKDRVSGEDAVCLAVCVGWRMAELYDSRELPGPPIRPEADGELPEHLPGVGEMSEHEKACALAAHVGADLVSLKTSARSGKHAVSRTCLGSAPGARAQP